jgi:hypothetical protein
LVRGTYGHQRTYEHNHNAMQFDQMINQRVNLRSGFQGLNDNPGEEKEGRREVEISSMSLSELRIASLSDSIEEETARPIQITINIPLTEHQIYFLLFPFTELGLELVELLSLEDLRSILVGRPTIA